MYPSRAGQGSECPRADAGRVRADLRPPGVRGNSIFQETH